MIYEYTYDIGMKVLQLFKEDKLATMLIQQDENGKLIIDYTLKSEYDKEDREKIYANYHNNLSKRIEVVDLFNEFIEMQATDRVKVFTMDLNVTGDNGIKCKVSRAYTGEPITPASATEDVEKTLARLEAELCNTGANALKINAYSCAKSGKGNNKKYTQLTLGDLLEIIRESMREWI
jgi:hypothetical protein